MPSIAKPIIIPMATFTPMIESMMVGSTCSAMNSGSISSDVDKNTANRVPSVMARLAYSADPAAENPHWGTAPNNAPTNGPAMPAFFTKTAALSPALCSSISSNK